MATVFDSPDDLVDAVAKGPGAGVDLGATGWAVLEPGAVRDFCRSTGADVPDGGAGAPPLMMLSLTNRFLPDLLEVRGASSGVNYGASLARFPGEAIPGRRIRVSARLTGAGEVAGGVQTRVEITVEAEGSTEPACVVESISRWMR